jgi:hypothetical protein
MADHIGPAAREIASVVEDGVAEQDDVPRRGRAGSRQGSGSGGGQRQQAGAEQCGDSGSQAGVLQGHDDLSAVPARSSEL